MMMRSIVCRRSLIRSSIRPSISASSSAAIRNPLSSSLSSSSLLSSSSSSRLFSSFSRSSSPSFPLSSTSVSSSLSLSTPVHRSFATTATDSKVPPENVRNIAIIAHVDHGKTTLVDGLLRQSQTRVDNDTNRVMDSNPLEKERGITILSKCTSVIWQNKANGEYYQINIVDTPGHADFGGEVERIMTMVDGVCLVIDAQDGPMTQTKFVLSKALNKAGMRPLVVVNKIDRPTARLGEVENEVLDLFMHLGATDEQADFPIVYASAREGWATMDPKVKTNNMEALFEIITKHVSAPKVEARSGPFSMLVTQIDSDQYFGKLLLGRVMSGAVKVGDRMFAMDPQGKKGEDLRVTKIFSRRGLDQVSVDEAYAGDIISLAGFGAATVNYTICDGSVTSPIPSTPIDPPTLSMIFSINDSPLGGREGTQLTTGKLRDRLFKEAEHNVSLQVIPTADADSFEVRGRGELQLGVLIETMRREGFELSVSAPKVVYKKDEQNSILEPLEEVIIDIPDDFSGVVIEKLSGRKGEMMEYTQMDGGKSRLIFKVPMRGLIGFRAELANETKGNGVMNTLFAGYVPFVGELSRSNKGAIISIAEGKITGYALESIQDRGVLFVSPGDDTYEGMVIGEHSKELDCEVNPVKAKQLTNIRSVSKEDKVFLTPPRKMSLEQVIAYVRDDEIIEITTKSIRLRKKILNSDLRIKLNKREKDRMASISGKK